MKKTVLSSFKTELPKIAAKDEKNKKDLREIQDFFKKCNKDTLSKFRQLKSKITDTFVLSCRVLFQFMPKKKGTELPGKHAFLLMVDEAQEKIFKAYYESNKTNRLFTWFQLEFKKKNKDDAEIACLIQLKGRKGKLPVRALNNYLTKMHPLKKFVNFEIDKTQMDEEDLKEMEQAPKDSLDGNLDPIYALLEEADEKAQDLMNDDYPFGSGISKQVLKDVVDKLNKEENKTIVKKLKETPEEFNVKKDTAIELYTDYREELERFKVLINDFDQVEDALEQTRLILADNEPNDRDFMVRVKGIMRILKHYLDQEEWHEMRALEESYLALEDLFNFEQRVVKMIHQGIKDFAKERGKINAEMINRIRAKVFSRSDFITTRRLVEIVDKIEAEYNESSPYVQEVSEPLVRQVKSGRTKVEKLASRTEIIYKEEEKLTLGKLEELRKQIESQVSLLSGMVQAELDN